MTKKPLQGTGTALVTPFLADGAIDEKSLRSLVDFQIDNGVDMIIPGATTGEGVTLTEDERARLASIVIDRTGGRIPVVVYASSNSTAKAVQRARKARKLGAAAILSVGPYYNKPTQQGFYEHFKAIAEAEDIPVIVYNVPARTGSNIEARTMLQLAQIKNIVAVKEASGNLGQIMDILRDRPADFRVLSGDDAFTLAVIALGGDGVISVVANETPGLMSAMVNAALEGNYEKARHLHYRLLPLMNINFIESSPIPVKAALAMMGLIQENYRLPLVPISKPNREKVQAVLEALSLLNATGAMHGSGKGN